MHGAVKARPWSNDATQPAGAIGSSVASRRAYAGSVVQVARRSQNGNRCCGIGPSRLAARFGAKPRAQLADSNRCCTSSSNACHSAHRASSALQSSLGGVCGRHAATPTIGACQRSSWPPGQSPTAGLHLIACSMQRARRARGSCERSLARAIARTIVDASALKLCMARSSERIHSLSGCGASHPGRPFVTAPIPEGGSRVHVPRWCTLERRSTVSGANSFGGDHRAGPSGSARPLQHFCTQSKELCSAHLCIRKLALQTQAHGARRPCTAGGAVYSTYLGRYSLQWSTCTDMAYGVGLRFAGVCSGRRLPHCQLHNAAGELCSTLHLCEVRGSGWTVGRAAAPPSPAGRFHP